MTIEKAYTKAEAYEFLIENPGRRLYSRATSKGKLKYVCYLFSPNSRKFERALSWDSYHLIGNTIVDPGPFYETPEPPKPESDYELPEDLSLQAMEDLAKRSNPYYEEYHELARRILAQARKEAAEMIAEAMLSKEAK